MATTPPVLGYGQRSEAPIDAVNQYMRTAPWYQALIKSFGQDPNNVHLNDTQKQQVIRAAQANGIVVDEGHDGQEVDDSGNFHAKSHKLRNTLIVAGIAGATLATMGAAGVFAGGAAAGGAAGGAATGAGVGLGETAATGIGGLSATSLGLGTTAGLGTAGAAAGAGAAGAGAFDAAGNFIGDSTVSSVPGGSSLWSQIAGKAGPLGKAIGSAATASGNNRLNQEQLALQANRDNITGNTAAENALLARSKQEAEERRSALIDVARASDTRNPNISQFDTHAPKQYSSDYLSSLTALEQAGLARLKADPTYSTNHMPALAGYKPLDVANLQGATGTKKGLFETLGDYVGPALTTYGSLQQ